MLHRLFLAIVVACSLMGVDAGYRTQDCNGCLNAHAIKVDKYVGYSSAPSQSETQKSTKSSKSSINQGTCCKLFYQAMFLSISNLCDKLSQH